MVEQENGENRDNFVWNLVQVGGAPHLSWREKKIISLVRKKQVKADASSESLCHLLLATKEEDKFNWCTQVSAVAREGERKKSTREMK